jgi:hypothetical protein
MLAARTAKVRKASQTLDLVIVARINRIYPDGFGFEAMVISLASPVCSIWRVIATNRRAVDALNSTRLAIDEISLSFHPRCPRWRPHCHIFCQRDFFALMCDTKLACVPPCDSEMILTRYISKEERNGDTLFDAKWTGAS